MRTFPALVLALALVACSDDTTPLADLGPTDDAAIDGLRADGPPSDGVAPDGAAAADGPATTDGPAATDGPWVPDMVVIPDGPLADATKQQVCQSLGVQYAAILKLAKACSAVLPVVQCTLEVNDALACPCSTYVNPQNTQAVQQLAALEQAWTALGCHIGIACPAVVCPVPSGAQCQASSGTPTGLCVDLFGP